MIQIKSLMKNKIDDNDATTSEWYAVLNLTGGVDMDTSIAIPEASALALLEMAPYKELHRRDLACVVYEFESE